VYHGPPELTVARAFTEWTLDPWMLALVLVLGGGYLAWRAGSRAGRWRAGSGSSASAWASWSSRRCPAWPSTSRCCSTCGRSRRCCSSWWCRCSSRSGARSQLVVAAFPARAARLEAAIRSRPARILTFPAITTFALVAVPFVMYFTSWYTAVFHSAAIRELTFLALMAPGFVFFWTLLRVDPVPKEYSYAVSMWITGAEVIGDAFLASPSSPPRPS
jgi:cytochrome c oxidase assembly factor CtaG